MSRTFERNKFSCPHCGGVIEDAYIARNPFPEMPCPSCSGMIKIDSLRKVVAVAPDERSSLRCPVSLKVAYRSYNEFITEYTKNVSHGGMYINTTRKHSLQEIVELFLDVPGLDHPLKITGEVVRVNTSHTRSEEPGIGIRFVDMALDSRKFLIDYIRSLRDCS